MSDPSSLPPTAGFYRSPSLEPTLTDERCSIVELMNTPRCPESSLARAIVAPGVTTQLHSLSIEERYVVESGEGLMELDGRQAFPIGPGDCVIIPAGIAQRVRNTGSGELIFLCVCAPRFEPHHYITLETTATPELSTDA